MGSNIRIGIVDADPDVRFGRRLILESNPDFEIVFESEGKSEDFESISEGLIDVLVLDQKLSKGQGVRFYQELSELTGIKQAPNCIITCSFDQPALTLEALEAGVQDVVSLEGGASQLVESVLRASSGKSPITLAQIHQLLTDLKPQLQLDLNFVRLVDELPEKLASNLRRLRQVWRKGVAGKFGEFDATTMANLIDRLPVKTLAQLIIKLHRSELLSG